MSSKHMKPSHGMPVSLAPDGCSIATVNGSQLTVVQTSDAQIVRSTRLHDHVKGRLKFLQWSKKSASELSSFSSSIIGTCSHRLLSASANHISVLDAHDEAWSAEIDAGDGTTFAHVEFAANPDEILALSDFGLQLNIFVLDTGEQRVIKSPKFSNPNTYALRPLTGHLAVIMKLDSGDVLTIHELGTYEVISSASIPTVDVQGLRWSPNGAWLALWDAPSAGTKVVVYTADGQHFRSYTQESDHDFGVKTVEWSPDSRLLALGKHDGTVDLINGATFTLLHVLGDPTSVRPIGRDVYLESAPGPGDARQYTLVPESPVFPYTYNVPNGSRVVSTILFNPSGSLIATVDQGLPHIVWMWSIGKGKPQLAGALMQKSSVRQLLWNTALPELLMTTADEDVVSIHQWICGRTPRITLVPRMTGGKHSVFWVGSEGPSNGLIWTGSPFGYAMGYASGSGGAATFIQVACVEDQHQPLCAEDFPPT